MPTQTLNSLLADLSHPLRTEIEAVRKIILGADPSISEGIKWNSLSFQTTEWFATWNWRVKDQIQLVMHLGAKARKTEVSQIDDPDGLLKWLAKDRALLTIAPEELESKKPALQTLIKDWIQFI